MEKGAVAANTPPLASLSVLGFRCWEVVIFQPPHLRAAHSGEHAYAFGLGGIAIEFLPLSLS